MSGESQPGNRGVARVQLKLERSLNAENYYEAHQMYRTLYFRYTGQKKYDDCLELMYSGATKLLSCGQQTSGADLTMLVLDTLEKKGHFEEFVEWVPRLGSLIQKLSPDNVDRDGIIVKCVNWSGDMSKCSLGYPEMHKTIAQILWAEGNTTQARHHYLLSRDGVGCGQMLVKLSQSRGYSSESDLFIVQVVLQQLCLKETQPAIDTFKTYTKYHPKIAREEPPFVQPILNFISFLFKTIETGQYAAFKSLCDLYRPSINRDESYEKYLEKIAILYFNAVRPPQASGMMGGLFGDLFNRLFQGFDDDEEDSEQSNSTGSQNRVANSVNASELD